MKSKENWSEGKTYIALIGCVKFIIFHTIIILEFNSGFLLIKEKLTSSSNLEVH